MKVREQYMVKDKFTPKGPYGALLTPYNEDGSISEEGLRRQVEFLIQSGISGIFPCGTTGEFVHLSFEENSRVLDIVVDQAKGRMDVLPGACSSNIYTTLKMVRHAEKLGCPCTVICPPYYIPLKQNEIIHFYRTIASSINSNIILYNIPAFTNGISMDTLEELMKEPNIIGIKDSSGNMKAIAHYVRLAKEKRPDFAVMTGSDDFILSALVGGCVGSMTALSGIIPEITTQIYQLYYDKDYEGAVTMQHSILKLLSLAESIAFPAGYKIIAECRGFAMGPSKQVVPEIGTARMKEIEKEIAKELYNILGNMVVV